MPLTKSVAVVGAGPGGLVCAHKLLRLTPFSVTIFEKASRVGGLWERNSLINPEMQTNFCRFTASFSDLAWESVDLGRPAPIYPKAWMVENYLQHYAQKYIPNECFEFSTRVTNAERHSAGWRITAVKRDGKKVYHFDYLVVATGSLSTPRDLDCDVDEMLRNDPLLPILHSTQYRQLEQMYPPQQNHEGKMRQRVLMIGGSHSGADISTLIASQASNARWNPTKSTSKPDVEIIHVMHNRMYAVPGISRDRTSQSVSFHPLEFTLCERANRGPKPISFQVGLASKQVNEELRMFCKAIAEGELQEEKDDDGLPPYAIMSETYELFVDSGVIAPVMGVVKKLEKDLKSGTIMATIQRRDSKFETVNNISAVINATGFDSCGSLSFLSAEVLKQLEFDPTNTRLPMVLDTSYMAQHSGVPGIAFLGFTPVNWGIMEMQARAIAAKWSNGLPFEDPASRNALVTHMRSLREAINDPKRRSEVPQYLFSDYIGLMEQAGRELKAAKINGSYGDYDGFVCAARYVGPGEDKAEAIKTMNSVQYLQQRIQKNRYLLGKVTFSGLLGNWIGRSEHISGLQLSHKFEVHPRQPTSPEYDQEYLILHYITGQDFSDDTRSVARYREADDELSIWTVKPRPQLGTDELFITFRFNRGEDGSIQGLADSLGGDLSYIYHLDFKGSKLHRFNVTRRTKDSPDYTVYFERPSRKSPTHEVIKSNREPWSTSGSLDVGPTAATPTSL